MSKLSYIAFAAVCFLAAGARAETGEQGLLSEIRVGLLAHDQSPIVADVESGIDFSADVLFASPRSLEGFGEPRPYVGVTLAEEGISHLHGGLGWDYDVGGRWFVSGALGLAVHDGDPLQEWEQTQYEQETEKALGCRVVFHLYAGVGYRLSRRWNVSAHWEHLSNGTLCPTNEGLENIGFRIGLVM
jgi:lipid A 3-O-deacylase